MDRRRSRTGPRSGLLIAAAAAIALLAAGLQASGVVHRLELSTVDTRFDIRGTQPAPRSVAVVGVDDVTFGELHRRWPFPRRLHARLIDRLHAMGARVIAYDVQFTEPTTVADDNALIDAIGRAGNVVLATTEVDRRGRTGVLGGDDVVRQLGARVGDSVMPTDPGGVIRRVAARVQGIPSFAVAAARRFDPRHAIRRGDAWIDFPGPPETIPTYSFSRVLAGKVPAAALRGRIVVVGATAPTLQDVDPTSSSGGELMSGPEVQAAAIDTILRDTPLRTIAPVLAALIAGLLSLLAPLAGLRFGPVRSALAALSAGAAYLVGAQLAFDGGLILPVVTPVAGLVAGAVATLAVHYARAALERRRTRDLFSRFVGESVVDEVLACAQDGLRLGGTKRNATVMFTDLRGFTSFAEQLDAELVIDVLNRYLGEMSEAILDHGGTLVAYMGDGIFAVFGAPLAQDDHADRALAAAREMLTVRLPRFNAWLQGQGLGGGFAMGIGLNTGPVMSGNVGSERRLEYTAIGDTTNTASRLESMTKGSGFQLFVAESTRAMLREQPPDLMLVGELEVRGREAKVEVWSLAEAAPLAFGAKDAAEPSEEGSRLDV